MIVDVLLIVGTGPSGLLLAILVNRWIETRLERHRHPTPPLT